MSEPKHTPGPWQVEPYVDGIDIKAGDGSPIAHVIAHVADRRVDSAGMPPDNARLIAAAPEMLEALRDLVDAITEVYAADSPRTPPGIRIATNRAIDVIARAEGREP